MSSLLHVLGGRVVLFAFAVSAMLTTFLGTVSAATIRVRWRQAAPHAAIAAALAVASLVFCGLAAINATRMTRPAALLDEPARH